jgi:hypothetical protein
VNRSDIGGRASIRTAVGLVIVGAAILGWPAGSEGEVLIPISEGHGLTAIDIVGAVPLVVGILWCEAILWQSRRLLRSAISAHPGPSAALLFSTGLGLGLLFASVVPSFWWWAVGAALAGTIFLATMLWLGSHVAGDGSSTSNDISDGSS